MKVLLVTYLTLLSSFSGLQECQKNLSLTFLFTAARYFPAKEKLSL